MTRASKLRARLFPFFFPLTLKKNLAPRIYEAKPAFTAVVRPGRRHGSLAPPAPALAPRADAKRAGAGVWQRLRQRRRHRIDQCRQSRAVLDLSLTPTGASAGRRGKPATPELAWRQHVRDRTGHTTDTAASGSSQGKAVGRAPPGGPSARPCACTHARGAAEVPSSAPPAASAVRRRQVRQDPWLRRRQRAPKITDGFAAYAAAHGGGPIRPDRGEGGGGNTLAPAGGLGPGWCDEARPGKRRRIDGVFQTPLSACHRRSACFRLDSMH